MMRALSSACVSVKFACQPVTDYGDNAPSLWKCQQGCIEISSALQASAYPSAWWVRFPPPLIRRSACREETTSRRCWRCGYDDARHVERCGHGFTEELHDRLSSAPHEAHQADVVGRGEMHEMPGPSLLPLRRLGVRGENSVKTPLPTAMMAYPALRWWTSCTQSPVPVHKNRHRSISGADTVLLVHAQVR